MRLPVSFFWWIVFSFWWKLPVSLTLLKKHTQNNKNKLHKNENIILILRF